MKHILAVFIAAHALLAGTVAVAYTNTKCFVCGQEPDNTVYVVTDKVTEQKVDVCENCVKKFRDCYLCGVPANANKAGYQALEDGRVICERDAKDAVLDANTGLSLFKEALARIDRMHSRFTSFPETNITVEMVDRIHLQSLFTIAGNDYHCPETVGYTKSLPDGRAWTHEISLMTGLPLSSLRSVCAHELAHTWVAENVGTNRPTSLAQEAQEGFCELVAYLYVDSLGDTNAIARIRRNLYTRGQINLFIDAANGYGFNDVIDWMRYGTDSRLSASDPRRIHKVEMPKVKSPGAPARPAWAIPPAPSPAVPTRLTLKAIFWDAARPTALINNRSFGPQEEGSVQVGTNKLTIRCLTIRSNSVTVRVNGGPPQELILGGD